MRIPRKRSGLLLLVVLAVSTLMMVQSASAQSMPTPAIPIFSVKLIDHSYVASYQHVDNFSVELTISNQAVPFVEGKPVDLYYNVRARGSGQSWAELYPIEERTENGHECTYVGRLEPQSKSDYTVLSFPLRYGESDIADIQVEAVLGYQESYFTRFYGQSQNSMPTEITTFHYRASEWSATQSTGVSDTPTPIPINYSSSLDSQIIVFSVLMFVALILAAVVIVLYKKQKAAKQVSDFFESPN
jgi:hypothetical protein